MTAEQINDAPTPAPSRNPPVNDLYSPPLGDELAALADLFTGGRLSGGAPVIAEYEAALTRYFGVGHAIAVNSGSSALHAALHAVGVTRNTEVILPATAPLPTALPVLTAGATPVIVDVLPGSLTVDPHQVRQALSPRTRAVISVPLWGYPVDCTDVLTVLDGTAIPLIEDAAQAHGTRVASQLAGTQGTIGCFSTHDRKLLSTGEGGFILTSDPELAERIEYYTRLGHLTGHTHGVNYKLAAPLATIGLSRLPHLNQQIRHRHTNTRHLRNSLTPGGLTELTHHDGSPNYYTLVLTAPDPHGKLAELFTEHGLPPDSLRYRYRPLYRQPLFTTCRRSCPNVERLTRDTFQVPVHPGMSDGLLGCLARIITELSQRVADGKVS